MYIMQQRDKILITFFYFGRLECLVHIIYFSFYRVLPKHSSYEWIYIPISASKHVVLPCL